MEYPVTIENYPMSVTREDIDYNTFVTKDENDAHIKAEKAKEWLEYTGLGHLRDGRDVLIVPAVLPLLKVEHIEQIKDLYPIGYRRASFTSPILVEDKPKSQTGLIYNLRRKIIDDPYISYNIDVTNNGREISNLEMFFTTKINYDFVKKEKLDDMIDVPEISVEGDDRIPICNQIKMENDVIDYHCKSMGISREEHVKKYGEKVSEFMVAAKLPAIQCDTVKKVRDGIFAFKKQTLSLFKGSGLYVNNFNVVGVSKHKNDQKYMTNIKIAAPGNFLINSYTIGARIEKAAA